MKRNLKNRNNKRNRVMFILILLLGISIAFALVSTTLKLDGWALVRKPTWSVYWDNPVVTAGSKSMTPPTIDEDNGDPENTKVTWNVTLDFPGDFYEFTVDAVNAGTVNASIDGISIGSNPALPDYIKCTIKYTDGQELEEGHILPKANGNVPTVETYKIRVEFDKEVATANSVNSISDDGDGYTFTASITYSPANDGSYDRNDNKMMYALYEYIHTSDDAYDDISDISEYMYVLNIGDILPNTIASPGPSITENYYCGPTTDYSTLKIEFYRYKRIDQYQNEGWSYYYKYDECVNYNDGNPCKSQKITYSPKLFYGFKINSSREIKNKYICGYYANKSYCIELETQGDEYESNSIKENFNSISQKLVDVYGEYDSSTEKGCIVDDNNEEVRCNSSDGEEEIKYTRGKLEVYNESKDVKFIFSGSLYGPYRKNQASYHP